ncbi:DUF5392 family protein [Gracilibacillus sp. YIM 98692]|uniref:DUF5392 family protein n=1 Tax=Gracilibacillus sp. YIM 98692 TaxID=2663532 RepID=UPI0013CF4554|nr:DUF5392 family protein [Gracilibacillus sp. YIM 98692]
MISFIKGDVPPFIKMELETLFQKLSPLIKKNTQYIIFALPLLFISVFNLIFFLFFGGFSNGVMAILLVYALMASVGLALYKESKHIKKQIRSLEIEHMVKRIQKSEVVNRYQKDNYITVIKNNPRLSLHTFMSFLAEENERQKITE